MASSSSDPRAEIIEKIQSVEALRPKDNVVTLSPTQEALDLEDDPERYIELFAQHKGLAPWRGGWRYVDDNPEGMLAGDQVTNAELISMASLADKSGRFARQRLQDALTEHQRRASNRSLIEIRRWLDDNLDPEPGLETVRALIRSCAPGMPDDMLEQSTIAMAQSLWCTLRRLHNLPTQNEITLVLTGDEGCGKTELGKRLGQVGPLRHYFQQILLKHLNSSNNKLPGIITQPGVCLVNEAKGANADVLETVKNLVTGDTLRIGVLHYQTTAEFAIKCGFLFTLNGGIARMFPSADKIGRRFWEIEFANIPPASADAIYEHRNQLIDRVWHTIDFHNDAGYVDDAQRNVFEQVQAQYAAPSLTAEMLEHYGLAFLAPGDGPRAFVEKARLWDAYTIYVRGLPTHLQRDADRKHTFMRDLARHLGEEVRIRLDDGSRPRGYLVAPGDIKLTHLLYDGQTWHERVTPPGVSL